MLKFDNPQWLATTPENEIVYYPLAEQLHIRLESDRNKGYGISSGMEGLGSEIFCDSNNVIVELSLNFSFNFADFLMLEQYKKLIQLIKENTKPGRIKLITETLEAVLPEKILFAQDFSLAVMCFDTDEHMLFHRLHSNKCYWVNIGENISFLINKAENTLRYIILENFAERQSIYDYEVSSLKDGCEIIKQLNEIHLTYFEGLPPQKFLNEADKIRKSMIKPINWTEEDWKTFIINVDRMTESYKTTLELL